MCELHYGSVCVYVRGGIAGRERAMGTADYLVGSGYRRHGSGRMWPGMRASVMGGEGDRERPEHVQT